MHGIRTRGRKMVGNNTEQWQPPAKSILFCKNTLKSYFIIFLKWALLEVILKRKFPIKIRYFCFKQSNWLNFLEKQIGLPKTSTYSVIF